MRSNPETPAAVTATRTSPRPGSGISDSTTVRTFGAPWRDTTTWRYEAASQPIGRTICRGVYAQLPARLRWHAASDGGRCERRPRVAGPPQAVRSEVAVWLEATPTPSCHGSRPAMTPGSPSVGAFSRPSRSPSWSAESVSWPVRTTGCPVASMWHSAAVGRSKRRKRRSVADDFEPVLELRESTPRGGVRAHVSRPFRARVRQVQRRHPSDGMSRRQGTST